jgi:hypothetical protein
MRRLATGPQQPSRLSPQMQFFLVLSSSFVPISALTLIRLLTWTLGFGTRPRVKRSLTVSFKAFLSEFHALLCSLVLSNKGGQAQVKGKDADLAKWDAEVRQSLAKKKSTAAPTLSKQEQTLVQAQVEKEAKIRSHVNQIKANLDRGLQNVSYLALGNIEDFRAYVSQITSLLLNSGALDKGTRLVGSLTFETFMVWFPLIPNSYANLLPGGVKVLFRSARYLWQMGWCRYAS